jgi:tRNA/tmRNA/rRNA uracil-C5-methylase (TrmA/RlmC/RlmD family)
VRLRHKVGTRSYQVHSGGFWQIHPAAAATFSNALLEALSPRRGERVLELYAGAGLFTAQLAERVGPSGSVFGIEADPQAVRDAALNVADQSWARVHAGVIDATVLTRIDVEPDLIVVDPPRAGLGAALTRALCASGARAIGYVSCDPSTLARDVRAARDAGWILQGLRAFDAFPMTHHVECIAVLCPA